MKQINLKDINMTASDFHKACQIGLALRITRVLKFPKQDFENMTIEQVENFVSQYSNQL